MDKIKQAIASDCERIIEAFVSTGNYEFQSFCNEWKRMQFQHIYSALMREIEIIQMTEAIFSTIGRILFENSHLTGQKIAALYLMYAIFFKQPTEQHIKFKLTLNNWKTLKGFIESIKDDPNTLEVRYIFYKLLSVNAFRFVVLERDCSLEPGLDRISSQKNNDEHSESIFNDDVNELAHPTRGYLESLSILEGGYNEMKRILNQNEETKSHSSFQKLESFNVIERFKSSFSKISDLLKKDADEDDSDENGSDSSYRKKREPVKRKATICEKRASIRNKAKSFRRREPTEDNGYDISLSGDMIQISKKTDNRVRSKQQNVEKLFSQKLSDDTLNELAYIEELPITGGESAEGLPMII